MTDTHSPHTPSALETQTMRELLARISAAALDIDVPSSLEQAAKLTALIVNLTKTIRETEGYNEKLEASAKEGVFTGTLEERPKGYLPTRDEEIALPEELKEHLVVLGPRLFEDGGPEGHDEA